MGNVKIHEQLCSSDNNKIHFDIKVKLESKHKIKYRRNFHFLKSETATECWNILKYEKNKLMSIVELLL